MPTEIVPSKTLHQSIAKANVEHATTKKLMAEGVTAVTAVNDQLCKQVIKEGKAYIAARKKVDADNAKKRANNQPIKPWADYFKTEKLYSEGALKYNFSSSYEAANQKTKLATYPNQARIAAKEADVFRINDTYTALSGATIEGEASAKLALSSKSTGDKHISSGINNDWYTPAVIIEAARTVMGSIDVDPASSDIAQSIVKAEEYYTIDDCGLAASWVGNVWLNPPYSMPAVDLFSTKLVESVKNGSIDSAIVLTNNGTDTKWFHSLLSVSSSLCIFKGRVKFADETGENFLQARQGQVLFYVGNACDRFKSEFKEFGMVVEL